MRKSTGGYHHFFSPVDGHMFLVTNALSVVSYWQFFCVTCHVEKCEERHELVIDKKCKVEVITTFSTLLTDPGPGMIFARRSTDGEQAKRDTKLKAHAGAQ